MTAKWFSMWWKEMATAFLIGASIMLLLVSVGNTFALRATAKSNHVLINSTNVEAKVLVGLEKGATQQTTQIERLLNLRSQDIKNGNKAFDFAINLITTGQAETRSVLKALCSVTPGCEAQLNKGG